MTIATVNELAAGIWATRVGQELELLGPGANAKHVIVKRPQDRERDAFGFPAAWLDTDTRPVRRRLRVRKGML